MAMRGVDIRMYYFSDKIIFFDTLIFTHISYF